MFTAGVSPARDVDASYVAWGHSTVVGPWGNVLATTDEKPGIVYADLGLCRLSNCVQLTAGLSDLALVNEVRGQIPIRGQKRFDVYTPTTPVQK